MGNETTQIHGQSEATEGGATDTRKRERSTIEFPYADLDLAIDVAQTINDRAGTSCETRQLAVWLNQTPTSGTFRSRLSAARTFGLTTSDHGQGQVSLSTLGRDILDSEKERSARTAAFIHVPLYNALYGLHNGHVLPPAAALERQMIELGVAKKQAERARQVFVKSAQQANFIDQKTGRLIKPAVSGSGRENEEYDKSSAERTGGGGDDGPPLHPFIQGLLEELPSAGSVWPEDGRKLWLETASGIFKMIYKIEPLPQSGDPQRQQEERDNGQ